MTMQLDEKLEGIYQDVLKRNPGEVEFHQAVVRFWNLWDR